MRLNRRRGAHFSLEAVSEPGGRGSCRANSVRGRVNTTGSAGASPSPTSPFQVVKRPLSFCGRQPAWRCIGLLAAWFASGCEGNHYRLEMSVEGDTLHRRLTCWRESGSEDDRRLHPMPDSELDRIARAYGVPAPESAEQEFTFNGDFQGSTPGDIGGAGALTAWTSDLGRSWAYVERFRGDDDLTASLDQRRAAVNTLCDVLLDWLHLELGDGPEFENARRLFQGPLRSDFLNLATYAWTAAAVQDAAQHGEYDFEFALRAATYAAERDYFDVKDVPQLLEAAERNDSKRLLAAVREALASKLDRDSLGEQWSFLDDETALQISLNRHLRQHAGYLEFVQRRQKAESDVAIPPPTEYVAELTLATVGTQFGGFDGLEASLQCPVEPYRTNGEWLADERVSWNRSLNSIDDPPRRVLPPLLYAMWSVPDADYQSARFGRVILQDEALAEYCLWHSLLTPNQQQQWGALLGGLDPGSPAAEWIEEFRFAPHDEEAETLAARGRELLLGALQSQ